MRRVATVPLIALAASVWLCGCGYATRSSLDPQYTTISVAPFLNHSREYDFQAPLTNAVTRKFIHDGRLKVVPRENADLLLEGIILDYKHRGLTYDRKDDVTQFLVVVMAGARLTDLRTNEVLWEDPAMAGESSFYTRAVGQSADRLRGNAEVFLPTVRSLPTEEENRGASEALEQLAQDIFFRTIEPW
ncbi:MAG: hypothetical protein KJ052_08780 [Candidatus Hydrogenedentes bacterium]|nr:hypothetical protein [Candidatus Hydrogenedentota bacterium]